MGLTNEEAERTLKRTRNQNDNPEVESSDSESDSEEELSFNPNQLDNSDEEQTKSTESEMVNVQFEFSDPRDEHFNSIRQLVRNYLPIKSFDISGFSNLIVSQVTAGTMIHVENEHDVLGFITALSLSQYNKSESIQQVMSFLQQKCPKDNRTKWNRIMETTNVGLLVNMRIVNLPIQLSPALHQSMHDDIEWAIENEDTEELRLSFQFDYFLVVAPCAVEKSQPKKQSKESKTVNDAKFYYNFEDEFLEQGADLFFTFPVPQNDREETSSSMIRHTAIMLIKRQTHKDTLGQISAMIPPI